MQQTSKWDKHLPYLHIGTLRVHNSVLKTIKIQREYQHTDAILDNKVSQLCTCLGSCGKILSHYLWDTGPMNATISRQQVDFVT